MAKFEKGRSGNPQGRPKGAPNKLTKELRATLKAVISDELEQLPELLTELEPKDRLELLIKLMPYACPRVQPVNSKADEPMDFDFT